jgi:hypothetical protein
LLCFALLDRQHLVAVPGSLLTLTGIMGWIENTNRRIATSPVGRWFKLEGCGHVSPAPPVPDAVRQC